MLAKIFLILALNLYGTFSREICYGDLGCFIDTFPFSGTIARPIAFLPESPEKINTTFTLFNQKTSNLGEIITSNNIGPNYYPTIPTKFIIHGFIQHAFVWWVIDMKNAILSVDNVNVITVDWSKGNVLPYYTKATANTQVVGAEIAKLINAMIKNKGALVKDFHLIGHSLGAHISGMIY